MHSNDQHDRPDSRGDRWTAGTDAPWAKIFNRHMNAGFGPHDQHEHPHGGGGRRPRSGREGSEGTEGPENREHLDAGSGPWRRGGPFGRGGPGHRGGRGRAQRGDVRSATLMLLAEGPMHGYQLMQAMAERTHGVWKPSPGAIYPTINQLEDEGLVTTVVEGGRKLVTLTEAGRALVEGGTLADPFAGMTAPVEAAYDVRGALEGMLGAFKQVVRTGDARQINAAVKVLTDARRSLYLILADHPGTTDDSGADPSTT